MGFDLAEKSREELIRMTNIKKPKYQSGGL